MHSTVATAPTSPPAIQARGLPSQTRKCLFLPNTMESWPWPRRINHDYEEVAAESNAWFNSLKPFHSPKSQYAREKCDIGLLVGLAYPDASREHLRTGADLMNVFYTIDEYTDVEPAPVVREMVAVVVDAIQNPDKPRPNGETVLGEIARQFWARGRTTATLSAAKHFVESFTDYLHSVIRQAEDRDNNTIRTIESYLQTRKEDVGVRPSLVIYELHLSIPDEAFYHPMIKELQYLIAELVIIDNDIASYNKEQATGDDQHNIITIAMHNFQMDIDDAFQWAGDFHKEVVQRFFDALQRVPSFGPAVDEFLHQYIEHIANFPRANDCWDFESGRYFGKHGREYQETRMVPMLPKRMRNPDLRRENVQTLLIEDIEEEPLSNELNELSV